MIANLPQHPALITGNRGPDVLSSIIPHPALVIGSSGQQRIHLLHPSPVTMETSDNGWMTDNISSTFTIQERPHRTVATDDVSVLRTHSSHHHLLHLPSLLSMRQQMRWPPSDGHLLPILELFHPIIELLHQTMVWSLITPHYLLPPAHQ